MDEHGSSALAEPRRGLFDLAHGRCAWGTLAVDGDTWFHAALPRPGSPPIGLLDAAPEEE